VAKKLSTGRLQALIKAITTQILVQNNIIPASPGGANLGSSTNRFANLFVQDLQLANERGDWSVVEEYEYLSIRNNKNGKLYKFVLEEVEED